MGRNIVITGANRGIGLALATEYVNSGDKVYALCRTTSDALSSLPVTVIEAVDVCEQAGIENMVNMLSGVQIDVLICNAGILRDESISNLNTETIAEQFNVNAIAPINVVSHLLNNFKSGSKVAMITSRMGSIEDNTSGGRYGYRMSKAALNIASVSLAKDLEQDNISVGLYHPGYVQTDMVNHGGDISSAECASRLHKLIEQQNQSSSGQFKHSNGELLPW